MAANRDLPANAQHFMLNDIKTWLFSDTPQGEKASAVCYSVVETAELNGIEPYQYFMITQLPYAETVE